MFHFDYDSSGMLRAEDVDLRDIADVVGTPTFVYSHATIVRHFRVYTEAFSGHPHLVCYSVKANTNGALLRTLAQEGSGADIVSGGELFRALRAGFSPSNIVFSGVGKTAEEIVDALDAGILCFNVESEPELDLIASIAKDRKQVAPISLRVNPNIDAKTHPYIATGLEESKFGLSIPKVRSLAQQVIQCSDLKLMGLDCHIGSQITSLDPLLQALDSVLALADELAGAGHHLEEIDLGGGLGIPYRNAESDVKPPHPNELGEKVVARMKGRKERIVLEPGRVIVGNAGILVSRVLYVKTTDTKTFVIVDSAMNDLLRPSLYEGHHEIWPVERSDQSPITVDVVGPICESGDAMARGRPMTPVKAGDLIAVLGVGAYGFVMSSNYNSRLRAPEVLVSGSRYSVVKERESFEDLVRHEVVPDWVEQK